MIFLQALAGEKMTSNERAVALLWFHGLDSTDVNLKPAVLCKEIEYAGYARQNTSRITKALEADKRTTKGSNGTFRIRVDARPDLDVKYLSYVEQRPLPRSTSVLPADMFHDTRGYIEKVVAQINVSYDISLYDCCAVMCLRLLETLIIELYEAQGRANEIKDGDGHFLMFSGLLRYLESDRSITIGRNGIKGLKDFKLLGDLSAHNRRFLARRDDIDRIRDGMRVAAEELLHLWQAALIPVSVNSP